MNLQKLIRVISLVLLMFTNNLYASNQIDITPFYYSNYSNNFSLKFKYTFDVELHQKDLKNIGKILLNISEGKTINQFGKEWIGVSNESQMIVNDEKIILRMVDLYDIKTKFISFTIDLDDNEITKYEWSKKPKFMKSGESLVVGRSTKRSSDQKLISSSEISYRLSVLPQGYEFCTIDKETELATKEKSVTFDCDLFDKQKKLIGNRLEVQTNNQQLLKGISKVEIEGN